MPRITQKKKVIITTAILIVGSFFLFSGRPAQAYLNSYSKLWDGTLSAGEWNNLSSDFLNKSDAATMTGPLGINISAPASGLQVNGPIVGSSYGGSMSAGNISSGYFGSNTSGGNYSFPGFVGIGTSSPAFALDVVGDINMTGTLRYNGNPFSSSQWLTNSTAIYYNSGNVGIGTSAPTSRLTLTGGDFQIDHNRSIVVNYGANSTVLIGNYADSQGFGYGTSTTYAASLAVEGDVKGNRFCIKEDCKGAWTDIVAAGGGGQWTVNGSDMYNSNSGNIGIGVTAPSRKLDISGSISIPYTTDANSGVIYKGANRFIHNFALAGTDGANTFLGVNAGNFTMTGSTTYLGSYNTGLGTEALIINSTGYNNTATGWAALHANTTGFNNTGLGVYAMYTNSTGNYNTAVGVASMKYNTSGTFNSALGQDSLYNNTTGSYNVAAGWNSGRFIADGATANQTSSNSVYIGTKTRSLASGDTNETVIGYDATGIGSNTVTLGNDSVITTALKGNVGIGTTTPSVKLDVMGSFRNTLATTHSLLGGAGNVLVMADNTGTLYSTSTASFISGNSLDLWKGTKNGNIWNGDAGAGNVGIGTISSFAKLSVLGDIWFTKGNNLMWDDTNDSIMTKDSPAWYNNQNTMTFNTYAGAWVFRDTNSGNISMLIRGVDGHVGIGATAPGSNLAVRSSGHYEPSITHGAPAILSLIDNGDLEMAFTAADSPYPAGVIQVRDVPEGGDAGYPLALNPLGGNVGVGTTASPGTKLDVSGSFRNTLATTHSLLGGGGNVIVMADNTGTLYSTSTSAIISPIVTSASGWTANGTTVYKTDTSGNVGIGTTNPSAKLEIVNGKLQVNSGGALGFVGSGTANLYASGGSSLYFYDNTFMAAIKGVPGTSLAFETNDVEKMRLTASGNLGIGTTTPSQKLEIVNGNIKLGTAGSAIYMLNAGGLTRPVISETASTFKFSSQYDTTFLRGNPIIFSGYSSTLGDDMEWMRIISGGNVGIGNTDPDTRLDVSGSFRNTLATTHSLLGGGGNVVVMADNTGTLYSTSTASFISGNSLDLWKGTKNGAIWNGDAGAGNVGIGKTTPSEKLEVYGTNVGLALTRVALTDSARLYYRTGAAYLWSAGIRANRNDYSIFDEDAVSERFTINAGGNVGIGVTNPSAKLDIQGTYNNQGFKMANDRDDGGINFQFYDPDNISGGVVFRGNNNNSMNVGIGTTTPQAQLDIYNDSSDGNVILNLFDKGDNLTALMVENLDGSNPGLIIKQTGNVGIGTTTPLAKLVVSSSDPDGTPMFDIYDRNDHMSIFSVEGSNGSVPGVIIKQTGNVGIAITNPTVRLDVAGTFRNTLATTHSLLGGGGNVLVMADNTGALYTTSTAAFAGGASMWGGTKNGTIYNGDAGAGNVGVGTITPIYKLDVSGTFRATASSSSIILDADGNISIGI